jgi:2-keto-4-pentenoate hydratase/2-oxohepta-3-ene-1,7-dioic acid hydratase in catechol pathway
MRLFSTDRGVARESSEGVLEVLDLVERDLGAVLLLDPELASVRGASVRETVAIGDVKILAPIIRPGKFVCMGINYQAHLDEVKPLFEKLGQTLPTDPVFFIVPGSAVAGPGDALVLPKIAPDRVDYEVELAAVIGRGGSEITEAEAMSHVVGYTLCNDVSARDIQSKAMSGGPEFTLTHAKGLNGFKPIGPALVTADEFDDEIDVRVMTRVNGEVRQDARTSDFVHSVAECVAYVSKYMKLEPGDLITTGSPAGVGHFLGVFLKVGDVVELSADRIGTLRSEVVAST